jgi:hypothetical protein
VPTRTAAAAWASAAVAAAGLVIGSLAVVWGDRR